MSQSRRRLSALKAIRRKRGSAEGVDDDPLDLFLWDLRLAAGGRVDPSSRFAMLAGAAGRSASAG